MTSNILCLNSVKTDFVLLGLQSQLNKIHHLHLFSVIVIVLDTASARNLSFIFDPRLTFCIQDCSVSREASTTSYVQFL